MRQLLVALLLALVVTALPAETVAWVPVGSAEAGFRAKLPKSPKLMQRTVKKPQLTYICGSVIGDRLFFIDSVQEVVDPQVIAALAKAPDSVNAYLDSFTQEALSGPLGGREVSRALSKHQGFPCRDVVFEQREKGRIGPHHGKMRVIRVMRPDGHVMTVKAQVIAPLGVKLDKEFAQLTGSIVIPK